MGRPTSIELFAGAGGLALGLEQAGFCHALLNEFSRDACETLRRNRPGWNVVEGDVHDVDFSCYEGQVDLVSGGFPCQAFSMAGKRLGFGDTRGTLFAELVRCVDEVRPRVLLFENVKGLLSHDKGRTLATILHSLDEAGYAVSYEVLDASLLGVGQKRERVVGVGVRKDLLDEGEQPPFAFPKPGGHAMTLAEALDGVPASPGIEYSDRKRQVLDLVPPGGCWRDLPAEVASDYMGKAYGATGGRCGYARRLAWDKPSPTLTTAPSQKQTELCHPDETRPLTVREYARIQSFPDDWEFAGGIGSQYRQIGNAVPVEMARRIGEKLIEYLNTIPRN